MKRRRAEERRGEGERGVRIFSNNSNSARARFSLFWKSKTRHEEIHFRSLPVSFTRPRRLLLFVDRPSIASRSRDPIRKRDCTRIISLRRERRVRTRARLEIRRYTDTLYSTLFICVVRIRYTWLIWTGELVYIGFVEMYINNVLYSMNLIRNKHVCYCSRTLKIVGKNFIFSVKSNSKL